MTRRDRTATSAPANTSTTTNTLPVPSSGPATTGNKPLRVFRARGVSVAVFENHTTIEGRPVSFLKAELRCVYRDGDEFRTTHALSVHDVPVARLLLEQAFAFMLEAGTEREEPATART